MAEAWHQMPEISTVSLGGMMGIALAGIPAVRRRFVIRPAKLSQSLKVASVTSSCRSTRSLRR